MAKKKQPKPKTVDERLEFLVQSSETLHEDCRELYRVTSKLTATVEKHEQDWERFRRTMRAALAEWFSDNGDEEAR